MPRSRLLVGMRHLEELAFGEWFPEQLQAYRQRAAIDLREPAWDRDAADSGEVGGNGEDVREVHLQRIVTPVAGLERGLRRGRRDDGVAFLEGLGEIVADERAHLLGAEVIGVIITAAQHVGAENDAPLDLGAEAFL